MKIETTTEFRRKVERQIKYISLDKPKAGRNFKNLIFSEIKKLNEIAQLISGSKITDAAISQAKELIG